ncbi:uncharacterized protein METZ01_LOCUS326603, partial [marine metagenome]
MINDLREIAIRVKKPLRLLRAKSGEGLAKPKTAITASLPPIPDFSLDSEE